MNVTIEPLAAADFATVAAWLSAPTVNEWLSSDWRGREVDSSLLAITVRNKKNQLFLVRADGQACGLVGLADLDLADSIAMIWYLLGNPAVGGKGVTAAAVRQLLDYAFDELHLEAIHAWIMEHNVRSRGVLEKSGFRETGRLRSAAVHQGERVDRIYFDITRSERSQ